MRTPDGLADSSFARLERCVLGPHGRTDIRLPPFCALGTPGSPLVPSRRGDQLPGERSTLRPTQDVES
jgi:hypothetical protein